MKIIINASTLSGTGVTQVAISFVNECLKFLDNEYHVFMSRSVANQLSTDTFSENFFFYLIESHPIYGLRGFKIRRRLRRLENEIKPDCVFTVFGPSWWTPKAPHLMGYAYPHYVYRDSPIFKQLSVKELLFVQLLKNVHVFFLKRNGKYFVCETEDVSKRLTKLLNVPNKDVYTVSNTYSSVYKNVSINSNGLLLPKSNEFRFITLCSFMKHKNLEILNKVIPLLNERISIPIKFVLTVDQNILCEKMSLEARKSIINLGKVSIVDCPQLYSECDALFLPTLLECFSANYPESMVMRKPILTSNLSFASSVCGDAAMYFNPIDPDDICTKMIELISDKSLYNNLILKGIKRLNYLESPESRAMSYLKICGKILHHEN